MYPTILYSLILFAIWYFSRRLRSSVLGRLLLLIYFVISVFGIGLVQVTGLGDDLGFLPYLFLIVTYMVYFYPFIGNNLEAPLTSLSIGRNNNYVKFAYIYVVCATVSVSINFLPVIQLAMSGNWAENKSLFYSGDAVYAYGSILGWICMQIAVYFKFVAITVSLIFMQNAYREKLGLVMIFMAEFSHIFAGMYASGRGSIFGELMFLICLLFYFRKRLPERMLTRLKIIATIFLGIGVFAGVVITISRFSEEKAFDSMFSYLGQAPVFFNYGVWDIREYMYGEFGWGELFGNKFFDPVTIGGTWGTAFYTFVGWFYIDWGPIGTLIIGFFVCLFFTKYFRRKKWAVSDFYLLLIYYSFLLRGVFVIGRSEYFIILSEFVIYLFLKYFVERVNVNFVRRIRPM